jgi:CheY-like chemotaxis protein
MDAFSKLRDRFGSSRGRPSEAAGEISALESRVAATPGDVELLLRLVDQYVASGRASEAVDRLVGAADGLRRSQRLEAALFLYDRAQALAVGDQRSEILERLAPIYANQGAFPRAFQVSRELVEFFVLAGRMRDAEAVVARLPHLGERNGVYRQQLEALIATAKHPPVSSKGSWLTTDNLLKYTRHEDFSSILILVVDDDPAQLELVEHALEPLGCQIVTAENGASALDFIARHRTSLIISDLMMPDMDGSQLFDKLQSDVATEAVPFVCLSSNSDEREVVAALLRGVEDYWMKPIRPSEFRARVHRILRRIKGSAMLSGSLDEMGIADLVQILELNKRTGSLLLESEGRTAVLYFSDGRPIDAVAPGKEGETAFYAVIGWREGRFQFSDHLPERPRRICASAASLLLEAMRRHDESNQLLAMLPPDRSTYLLLVNSAPDSSHFPPGCSRSLLDRLGPLLDGSRALDEILVELEGELEALQLLVSLVEKGDVDSTGPIPVFSF